MFFLYRVFFPILSCDILLVYAVHKNQVAKAPDGNGGVYAGNPDKRRNSNRIIYQTILCHVLRECLNALELIVSD
jgi:hypothetical protein